MDMLTSYGMYLGADGTIYRAPGASAAPFIAPHLTYPLRPQGRRGTPLSEA
jgi:hypothetical protein